MADPEQFATPHESLVELLRCMPRHALVELICRAHGMVLGEITEIHERTPTIEIPGLKRRARKGTADLVFTVHTKDGDIITILIVECQLSWDHAKRWDWALYPTAYAAEGHCKAILAVFCPDPTLRGRYRKVLPEIEPRPALIEPDQLELIGDDERACSDPHRTILAAIFHARERTAQSTRVAGIRAALLAVQTLEPAKCLRYSLLMVSLIPPDVYNLALERLRAEVDQQEFEGISDLERDGTLYQRVRDSALRDGLEQGLEQGLERGLEQGLEQGLERGLEQGLERGLEQGQVQVFRRVLLDILELRGFTSTAAALARIEACGDLPTLEAWYDRARTWDPSVSIDDLLG
jgi:hypothetical protein